MREISPVSGVPEVFAVGDDGYCPRYRAFEVPVSVLNGNLGGTTESRAFRPMWDGGFFVCKKGK
ncbi:MAG: hypothetical protein DBY45_06500 [Clostridiales bacterium]|nr:MAG: hypothetical protein DBY45_06500 [Clostridiales bacterium]